VARLRDHGIEHGRRAEDQQNVGDVGADHVADADVGCVFQARRDRNHQLGHRGGRGDHGQADQQRRQAQTRGERHGAAQKDLAAKEKQEEAAGDHEERHQEQATSSPRGWKSGPVRRR
jgi:hypothetical protein